MEKEAIQGKKYHSPLHLGVVAIKKEPSDRPRLNSANNLHYYNIYKFIYIYIMHGLTYIYIYIYKILKRFKILTRRRLRESPSHGFHIS